MIARTFAKALRETSASRLCAVGSRSLDSAERFSAEVGCPRAYAGYEELIAAPDVEAIYVATPHPAHAGLAIAAIRAGKHVLCEKPLTLDRPNSLRVIEAAKAAQVTLMEAYMYRCHPQTLRLRALLEAGAIGEVGLIRASFGFRASPEPGHRLFTNSLGGGGILDVGGYPVSMARLLVGAMRGLPVAEPRVFAGLARLSEGECIDLHASAALDFGDAVVAQISCGVGLDLENSVHVYGTTGSIHVRDPWFAARPEIVVHRPGGAAEVLAIDTDRSLYAYEADAFADAVRAGMGEVSTMPWADSLGNMAVLDEWRAQAGVVYHEDAATGSR